LVVVSTGKKIRLYFGAIVVVLFVAIISLEVLLRFFLPHLSVEVTRNYSIEYLPTVYARHRLEPQGRMIEVDAKKAWGKKDPDKPSKQMIYISDRGYRGPSFDVRKPAGVTRVMVLGGSSVFDPKVMDEPGDIRKAWPNKLEAILEDKGFESVEVINAGVPGHSALDSLGRLVSQLWYYEPDFVLIYHGWNDMKFLAYDPVSPEMTMLERMQPLDIKKDPFKAYQGGIDEFASISQLYVRLRYIYYDWVTGLDDEGVVERGDQADYSDEYSEYGLKQYKLAIEMLVESSRLVGAEPILIAQGTLLHLNNKPEDVARIKFNYQKLNHAGIVKAYSEMYAILSEISLEKQVPYFDAATLMNGNAAYFVDHVHLSDEGGTILANYLATELQPLIE
jgi:lysophospholipase L1-like esterase